MPRYDFKFDQTIRVNAETLVDAIRQIQAKNSPYVKGLIAHAEINSPDDEVVSTLKNKGQLK